MLRPSTRGGVPVFMRPDSKPKVASCSVIPYAAFSPERPPPNCFSPMCITALRKVPLVSTTDRHGMTLPMPVRTPVTRTLPSFPVSVSRPVTVSWRKWTLGVCSSFFRQVCAKSSRSFCVRGLHMAGPLLRFSIRNWTVLISLTIPEYPPSASISRTICPLPTPPMAGLQLIWAITPMFMVINSTELPKLAAAAAASQPAWPPPTTMMS